jgi:hypothetical protein
VKIAITPIDLPKRGLSEIAFLQKAGLVKRFFSAEGATVAILPSAVVDEHFARCKLGVLVSAGAATC